MFLLLTNCYQFSFLFSPIHLVIYFYHFHSLCFLHFPSLRFHSIEERKKQNSLTLYVMYSQQMYAKNQSTALHSFCQEVSLQTCTTFKYTHIFRTRGEFSNICACLIARVRISSEKFTSILYNCVVRSI